MLKLLNIHEYRSLHWDLKVNVPFFRACRVFPYSSNNLIYFLLFLHFSRHLLVESNWDVVASFCRCVRAHVSTNIRYFLCIISSVSFSGCASTQLTTAILV